jgi:hypothetical protein
VAVAVGLGYPYLTEREAIERLLRAGISEPLGDGRGVSSLQLAERLGILLDAEVTRLHADHLLLPLDGKIFPFAMSRNAIEAKLQQICRQLRPPPPPEPRRLEHVHTVTGQIDTIVTGTIAMGAGEARGKKRSAARKTGGATPNSSRSEADAFREFCINQLVDSLDKGRCLPDTKSTLTHLRSHSIPKALERWPDAAHEPRSEARWAKAARERYAKANKNRELRK